MAGPAPQPARRVRLAVCVGVGVRVLGRAARRPGGAGRAERAAGVPGTRRDAWCDDWAAFAGGGAIEEQVRFEREWLALRGYAAGAGRPRSSATCRSTSRPTAATTGLTPELFLPLDELVAGAPPDDLNDLRPAVGQPALRLAGDGRRRLPVVDRADAARARPRRRLPDRPLPRVRRRTGRSPRARRPRVTAGGRRGRAGRSSVPPRRRSGRCR